MKVIASVSSTAKLARGSASRGVRLPAAWLLGVYFGYGLAGIWMGLCGELVVRAGLFLSRFLHGGWQKVKV